MILLSPIWIQGHQSFPCDYHTLFDENLLWECERFSCHVFQHFFVITNATANSTERKSRSSHQWLPRLFWIFWTAYGSEIFSLISLSLSKKSCPFFVWMTTLKGPWAGYQADAVNGVYFLLRASDNLFQLFNCYVTHSWVSRIVRKKETIKYVHLCCKRIVPRIENKSKLHLFKIYHCHWPDLFSK